MSANRDELASLADELTEYANGLCPAGFLPTPGLMKHLEMFSKIVTVLRSGALGGEGTADNPINMDESHERLTSDHDDH